MIYCNDLYVIGLFLHLFYTHLIKFIIPEISGLTIKLSKTRRLEFASHRKVSMSLHINVLLFKFHILIVMPSKIQKNYFILTSIWKSLFTHHKCSLLFVIQNCYLLRSAEIDPIHLINKDNITRSVALKKKKRMYPKLTSDSNVIASPCSVKRSLFCKLSR